MGGISGVWNLDDRPVEPVILARMTATLAPRGPDGSRSLIDGPAGFSCQHQWVTPEEVGEFQPVTGSAGVMLVIDGRLDNRDDLVPALGLSAHASDAVLAVAAYRAWDDRFVERLNGDFALAVYDAPKRRLIAARDSIGVRPLYYVHNDRLFAFASEIKALIAHPDLAASPHDDGIADYLLVGARPIDRHETTCFAGVSAVVPAHALVVTPRGIATRRYWDFDTGRPIQYGSFVEYAEAFRERFQIAVGRRLRAAAPVAISVSGGLDSSSIHCQAHVLQQSGVTSCPRVVGISYVGATGTDADEQRYLTDIEHHHVVTIDRFPIEPLIGLVEGAEDQIFAMEAPLFDYMWGVTKELHRRASGHGARVLLSGTWGDQVLFSSGYLVDLFRRLRWGTILRHLAEYGRWLGEPSARLLTRRFAEEVVRYHVPRKALPVLKRWRRRLSSSGRTAAWYSDRFLASALRDANRPAEIGSGFHSVQARSIYLQARSTYHVHCLEWNNKIAAAHGLQVAFPFLDRDLLSFLIAIPGEVQNSDGVPRAILREAMRGLLPEPLRMRNWKANFTDIVNAGVVRDTSTVTRVLSRTSLGVRFGYLDAQRLEPEVAHLAEGLSRPDCVASWSLADLFGLEVWLQVFFGGRAAQPSLSSPLSASTR